MRSGNTFCVAAFMYANGGHHHIGRHLHAPAHVLHAVRLGLPTIVLVRDPRDACVSHVIRRPELALGDSLQDYIDFYRTLDPVREMVVVAPFERAVRDFGSITEEVNDKYGTDFALYEPTAENDAAVIAVIEQMNRHETGGEVDEHTVARPSGERTLRRQVLVDELDLPELAEVLATATHQYERWIRAR